MFLVLLSKEHAFLDAILRLGGINKFLLGLLSTNVACGYTILQ